MEQIKIAELAIDNKKLLSELQRTKKSIEELSTTQKELKKSGDTTSKGFIQNEARLKSLKTEYNSQIKVLQATSGASQKLTTELNKQIKSVDEAKSNNKELIKVRNQLNDTTEEGAKSIAEINDKIDENNEKIKENTSQLEQQKQAIGDYAGGIKEASEELNIFNGGLGGFIQKSKESGGAGTFLTNSLKGIGKGFIGITKASLGFIATPVGALLAVLVGAFLLVKNAMNRTEDATNKIKKAFSAFQGITNSLMKILEPLGTFLIDGLVKGFELVEKGIYKSIQAIASGLEFLGFDEQAKSLRNFNAEVQQGAKDAKILADAEANLTKAQRLAQKVQLDYQKDAEKLRQIRDDESKSIKERIQANEQLGNVLQNQLTSELAIAKQALIVAKLRIKAEGENKETLDAQAEALTTISDIQERLTGQESEQLVNRNSLYKEGAEKQKEANDKAIQSQQEALDKFIEQQGIRAKTLKEQLKIDEEVAKKSIEILDAELKNKNITQEKYDTEYLKIQNQLLLSKANITIENAQTELDAYVRNNISKLDNDKFFSDESLKIEQARIDGIAEKQRQFAKLQYDEGIINKTDYDKAIQEIDEANYQKKLENDIARKEAQKEADAIDLENKLLIAEEQFQNNFELASNRLELRRLQEIEASEKSGADVTLINQKYAQQQAYIEQELQRNRLSTISNTSGQVAKLLGENSQAGKAAGIAQATINTYQGVTEVWKTPSTLPEPFATGAKIVSTGTVLASGLASVKKITSVKTPKAERGALLSGKRHSQGGIPIEAEDGEVIINRKSSAMYLPLLSQLNQDGGGIPLMAKGGIAGSIRPPANTLIDYDKLAQAYESIPAPRVAVDEIVSMQNQVSVIESQSVF